MTTGVLVGLAALAILGVGVVGASGVLAPSAGMSGDMSGGMGGGMMDGGPGGMQHGGMMGDTTCDCQTTCPNHEYHHNSSWNYSNGS